ncbi:hypothetical protein SAMN05428967_0388 [Phyllobacterium sp. YR620]|uniref:hypothetical protein n=1 Tax=Phyllobacterium sp. YR620 TaxID=1881066 RepID=UPI0008810E4C|nr:hypothetical protein [Phyllobacterium sp. YR620]SDO87167.1 hypothetical protein SAMN05428967_0388 [Phyllobacterium sp. YR620]
MKYLEALQERAESAQAVETLYRHEAAARIASLEQERAFAFRRLNLMRTLAAAMRPQAGDGEWQHDNEIAVARAIAALLAKLGWSSDSDARDAMLDNFTPVIVALHRAELIGSGTVEEVGEALARFEAWYAATFSVSFWMLFENPIPDTPRVDF